MPKSGWFDVDKEGLRKLLEHRGKAFAIFELVQNAWDESTTRVDVYLESIDGSRGRAKLTVVDDNPEGFKDIRHAYTLFAESLKKNDPEKRGRFNLGEKLVLALCDEAKILSVNDSVAFESDGTRRTLRTHTEKGSRFEAIIRMTKAEVEDVTRQMDLLIPPPNIETYFNRLTVVAPILVTTFETSLPTFVADDEGVLRSIVRKTKVEIYEPDMANEKPMLYEMGIPVVESDIQFHINIMQKVPLNQDRDNVNPAYFRQVCREVLNHTYELVPAESATDTWVKVAMEDPQVSEEAFTRMFHAQHGENIVSYDPTDPEAANRAVSNGYTVIFGPQMSKSMWDNARRFESIAPASKQFATPKPFYADGTPAEVIEPKDWSQGMREVAALVARLSPKLVGRVIETVIVKQLSDSSAAACGPDGVMYFSLKVLKPSFFESWHDVSLQPLLGHIIHEFAHVTVGNHLSQDFYKELQRLGARMTRLALEEPGLFQSIAKQQQNKAS